MLGFLCADPLLLHPTNLQPLRPIGPPPPPASSCQVYGSKVTMNQPACENIELQKHPWVRGCVNGAFSAGTNPGPVLLTDGQQMAFCVQRGRARGDRKGKQRRGDTELMAVGRDPEVFENSSVWGPICRSEMPYHMTRLTSTPPLSEGCQTPLQCGAQSSTASKATIHLPPVQQYSKGNR